MEPFRLDQKVAVVTGGASGIGESICLTFAQAGATIALLDRNPGSAQLVVDKIEANGHKAIFFQVDVTDQQQMVDCLEKVVQQLGRLDIMVNNAGIAHIGTVETTTEADFDKVFAVNVKGVYNGMYAAVPLMKKQGGGVILNMGSISAEIGLPDRFAYSMSKGAVLNMTYTVARDCIDVGIRCNSIAPARVHTPFVDQYLKNNYPGNEAEMYDKLSKTQPIGRMGQPKEIAHLALYLCSEEAAFITGTNFPIDGGFIRLNT